MDNLGLGCRISRFSAVAMLFAATMVNPAVAQERRSPSAELAAGWVGFADDGIVSEGLVGVAARWYLSPRISVGPEVVHLSGNSHSHLMVTGNLTWDLLAPAAGRLPRATPFLVAGGGLFRTRETFLAGPFTSSEGAFTAGGGVRAPVGERVTIGIDARVGWELHLRINGSIGVRLRR
ncbi:MAG: hypothetical protein IT176_09750 [Acidobacteria bacterium]|nr:hypothetical protein [Acidobacteriota bacterium]